MDDFSRDEAQQMVEAALQNSGIAKSYMNGFNIGYSASDLFLATNLMGETFNIIHMSFTTAKTLMQALEETINLVEKKMGQPIRTMDEMRLTTENEDTV